MTFGRILGVTRVGRFSKGVRDESTKQRHSRMLWRWTLASFLFEPRQRHRASIFYTERPTHFVHERKLEFGTAAFWNVCASQLKQDATNLEEVLDLLKGCGEDWKNVRDTEGCTILHHACMQGSLELANFCLSKGADPNVQTFEYESTPLKWAVLRNYPEICKALIENNADPQVRDFFGYTPLHYACLQGNCDLANIFFSFNTEQSDTATDLLDILAIFSGDEDVDSIDDESGFTPLHIACGLGRKDIVRGLLELGAAVDESTREGRTPLFFAVGGGHNEVVAILLDYGANLWTTTTIRKSCSHVATPGWSLLHEAAEKNAVSTAKLLLDSGIEVDALNVARETSLTIAVQNGNYEIACLLLEQGADLNIGDDWNTTPLHTACRLGDTALVELLLKYKVDVDSCNKYSETALHVSCWLGRYQIAALLLENGADISAKNKDQQNPVDYSKHREHKELVALLTGE